MRDLFLYISLHALDDHRDALAATNARRREAITLATTMKLVQHRQHEPRSRRTEWMSECNRAAVNVGPIAIESQLFFHSQILRGKRLIYLDKIDIVQR